MLQIRLLGGLEASLDGMPLPSLGPQLCRLLALLTLESNRPVETSRLWQTVWPESRTDDVVRQSLKRLREALGPEAGRLQVESGRVCFDLQGAQVDIVEFAALVEQGRPDSLEQAVKLYRGGLLPNWNAEWITAAREDLEVSYLDALKALAAHTLQAQDYLKAAHYLRRFVNGCPEMEWGWEMLIDAYLRADNRIKALEVYQAYTDFLQRESRARRIAIRPSTSIEKLIEDVVRQEQTRALALIQGAPIPTVAAYPSSPSAEESVGGAAPIGSPYYIERPEDNMVYTALAQPGSTILIKGPRQIGKTSLLARALHRARQQGACVLLTDWQNLAHAELESAETFFLSLAHSLADQLDLEGLPEETFLPKRPPSTNFERFLRRQVFPAAEKPIVWGIDEADRLFPCDFCDDVFGKFRSWHNERALDPDGPWRKFSLVLAYSTEASLFIKNANQSPFNVGTRVTLRDLTIEQVGELNARYGALLSPEDLTRLYRLVGGHPYLVRRCLYAIQHRQGDMAAIEAHADREDGIFTDHLERMRFALLLDAEMAEAVRQWLCEQAVPSQTGFARLCAAGIMTGSAPSEMRPRCQLYERYLKRHLR